MSESLELNVSGYVDALRVRLLLLLCTQGRLELE